jgi:hypothetical protein
MNTGSTWLFNVMLWGAIASLAMLVYDRLNPEFLTSSASAMTALIAVAVVAVLSALWPRF